MRPRQREGAGWKKEIAGGEEGGQYEGKQRCEREREGESECELMRVRSEGNERELSGESAKT